MIGPLAAGLSGARAFARKVDVAARNLANAGTEGFEKGRVVLAEGPRGGVTARAGRAELPGPAATAAAGPESAYPGSSRVDLAEEIVATIEGQRGFELNLKTIQTADEMLGALLDLKA